MVTGLASTLSTIGETGDAAAVPHQFNLDRILAIGGKTVAESGAAAGSEGQAFVPFPLIPRIFDGFRIDGHRGVRVRRRSDGRHTDAPRYGQIAFEQQRRDAKYVAVVIEPVALVVGRQ